MTLTKEERKEYEDKIKQNTKIENGCWNWLKYKNRGYGQVSFRGSTARAHRLSYAVFKGDFDDSWCVCHTCDNRACVNPDHLWLGTIADDMRDRDAKGRQAKGEKNGMFGKGYLVAGEKNPMFGCTGEKHPMFGKGHFISGEKNHNAKLTGSDIRQIFHRRAEGFTQKQIAKEFGITEPHVYNLLKGRTWSHLGLAEKPSLADQR